MLSKEGNNFHGVDVIFSSDSMMKLEMVFFAKLLGGSLTSHGTRGLDLTFIETNGDIYSTLCQTISTLKTLQSRNKMKKYKAVLLKKVILLNSV
jgi:hypothetical protein